MDKKRIFYIGGASGSGKTFSTRKLSNEYSVSTCRLDNFYDKECGRGKSKQEAEKATRSKCQRYIESQLNKGEEGIIEGGWIEPHVAATIKEKFPDTFFPVYAGYANDDPESRLKKIKQGGTHWLCLDESPIAFIKKQILDSQWYEEECEKYKIMYIDYSQPEIGNGRLKEYFNSIFKE